MSEQQATSGYVQLLFTVNYGHIQKRLLSIKSWKCLLICAFSPLMQFRVIFVPHLCTRLHYFRNSEGCEAINKRVSWFCVTIATSGHLFNEVSYQHYRENTIKTELCFRIVRLRVCVSLCVVCVLRS